MLGRRCRGPGLWGGNWKVRQSTLASRRKSHHSTPNRLPNLWYLLLTFCLVSASPVCSALKANLDKGFSALSYTGKPFYFSSYSANYYYLQLLVLKRKYFILTYTDMKTILLIFLKGKVCGLRKLKYSIWPRQESVKYMNSAHLYDMQMILQNYQ